jgi:predicted SnoaL-like aldol condensation-catalyzing enzyme
MHPNLAIMSKLDIENLDACADIFADNFVWHYFNPQRPELEGNYQGLSGLNGFFAKLKESSNGAFQVNPVEARAVGDELVVVQACNRFASEAMDDGAIEFDAVVVWRIVNGKIAEAWDIPAVHSVRPVDPGQGWRAYQATR